MILIYWVSGCRWVDKWVETWRSLQAISSSRWDSLVWA